MGPLPGTVHAFWRAVLEFGVRVMIMTTNFVEKGAHKCAHYLPTSPTSPGLRFEPQFASGAGGTIAVKNLCVVERDGYVLK